MRIKSKAERENERQLRQLAQAFERRGISIRREKLSRGTAYRVKSGECIYTGRPHLFVDRRLPSEQQISLLVDFLVDLDLTLEETEVEGFTPRVRKLLDSRGLLVSGGTLFSEPEFSQPDVTLLPQPEATEAQDVVSDG